MAFSASISSSEGRAFSLGGPLKCEIQTYSAASADIGGTITAKNLHQVYQVLMDGVVQTAAISVSGKTVTVTFADPAATVYGTIMLIGV